VHFDWPRIGSHFGQSPKVLALPATTFSGLTLLPRSPASGLHFGPQEESTLLLHVALLIAIAAFKSAKIPSPSSTTWNSDRVNGFDPLSTAPPPRARIPASSSPRARTLLFFSLVLPPFPFYATCASRTRHHLKVPGVPHPLPFSPASLLLLHSLTATSFLSRR